MRRILVTGATGFIGRNVVAALADRGIELHTAGRRRPDAGVEWHDVDLLRRGEAAAVIEAVRPTDVLHLAWYAETGRFWSARENLDWITATIELVEAFANAGGERFVGVGSCAEYDWSGDGVCDERRTPLLPATLYGAAKAATWHVLRALSAQSGFSHAWARIFFLYGPREPRDRLVASVTRALLRGEKARTTEGSQRRDFLHVRDVAEALVALLLSRVEGPVNIGSGAAVAVRDVVKGIGAVLGKENEIDYGAIVPERPEPPLIVAATERLAREVGWQPRIELRTGLADTVESWKREPAP